MGCVHAWMGAVAGALCRGRAEAFLAGAALHSAGDMIPHREANLAVDAALIAGTLAYIAHTRGTSSPEFAGALGGMAPDAEHVLTLVGVQPPRRLYPTHNRKLPHNGSHTFGTQVAAGAVSVLLAGLLFARRR